MLKSKVVLVTGSSKGLGREISTKMAAYGASVIITYLSDEEGAKGTLREIQEYGNRAICLQLNVCDEESVKCMFYEVEKYFGKIDILVNNAGRGVPDTIEKIGLEEWNRTISINLTGTFLCTKYSLPLFKKANGGRIINVSSVAGLTGGSFGPHYGASKAGLIGLTKSCARDLAKNNITVNVIAPGPIESEMTQSLDEEVLKKIIEGTPLARTGKMSEIAEMVCLLSNPKVGFITGQTIVIDGGRCMI